MREKERERERGKKMRPSRAQCTVHRVTCVCVCAVWPYKVFGNEATLSIHKRTYLIYRSFGPIWNHAHFRVVRLAAVAPLLSSPFLSSPLLSSSSSLPIFLVFLLFFIFYSAINTTGKRKTKKKNNSRSNHPAPIFPFCFSTFFFKMFWPILLSIFTQKRIISNDDDDDDDDKTVFKDSNQKQNQV